MRIKRCLINEGLSNMADIVRQVVFSVAGFGTRFLPVIEVMPKKLLPVVDKDLV